MFGEAAALSGIIFVLGGCLAGLGMISTRLGEVTEMLRAIAEILETIAEKGDEDKRIDKVLDIISDEQENDGVSAYEALTNVWNKVMALREDKDEQ